MVIGGNSSSHGFLILEDPLSEVPLCLPIHPRNSTHPATYLFICYHIVCMYVCMYVYVHAVYKHTVVSNEEFTFSIRPHTSQSVQFALQKRECIMQHAVRDGIDQVTVL